jgi:hypoxanthine phosphoribosyltransferase
MTQDNPSVLISSQAISDRLDALAARIEEDYRDSPRLVCVGVLKGGVFFLVDLLRRIKRPLVVDFLQASSYGASTRPGEVHIIKDLDLPIADADVLLVEDIVDTGNTLHSLLELLKWRGARSLRLCSLLDKPSRREAHVDIDYLGFTIEDVFVVGYGLDFDEHYRNLPYVGVLEE